MISREELKEIARFEKLKIWQEEKKYVQIAVLNSIYSHLSNELIFKGGTALFLAYSWKRFSQDLDFTSNNRLNFRKLPKIIARDLELLGMENDVKIIKEGKVSFSFRISVKGPLYTKEIEKCHVKIEISKRENVLLGYQTKKIFHNFPDLPEVFVPVMKLQEIGAEKVRAILTRDEPKDLVDLYFIISKVKIPLTLINEKLKFYKTKFTKRKFKERVLLLLRDLEKVKPLFIGDFPDLDNIKKSIIKDAWLS